MRYRPFGRSGSVVSTITLRLGDAALARGPAGARELIYAALEGGVNTFQLLSADPVLAELAGEALSAVDRKLVFVSLRLGQPENRRGERDFSAEGLTGAIDRALRVSGLDWIDLALLDEPGGDELSQTALNALKAQRSAGRVRLLGIAGEGEVMDAYVSTNAFDVLATPFHANSPWAVRHRVRAAAERDMAVMAYGYFPEELSTARRVEELANGRRRRGLFGWGAGKPTPDNPLEGAGTFQFLHRTPNWDAEQICLAFALTDPMISTVMVDVDDPARFAELLQIPERDLPPGLSAQIEMARVRQAA